MPHRISRGIKMIFGEQYQEDFKYILHKFPVTQIEGSSWLITGASGFMMTYLIRFLLYVNEYYSHPKIRLHLLCRNREKLLCKLGLSEETSEMRILEQDVTEQLTLCEDIDYVVHGASISATRLFATNPVEVILANTVGLNNVLANFKGRQIKSALFLSSGAVYGETPPNAREIKENDYYPLNFTNTGNCYAASKRLGELLMASYYAEYGLPCKSVRISHTYGPGIDLNDGHVYSDFVRDILSGQDLVISGDGAASRPFCYVADAIVAFLLILCRGENGESYNMANNRSLYSIYELAQILAKEVTKGRAQVRRKKEPHGAVHTIWVDTMKLEKLGWFPEIDVTEGFGRTVRCFEEEMMKKILITGGGGFIGRNLEENLKEDYEVCAPKRQELDLTDTEQTRQYLKEESVDTVIHCANTNNTRYSGGGG